MLFKLLLLILITIMIFAKRKESEYFDPTLEESERFITVYPVSSWGAQMRREKSSRILVLGGSNAKGVGCPGGGFARQLREFIEKNNDSSSYLINLSRGGAGASNYVGETFEFESWAHNLWPNIILFETAVNDEFAWKTAQNIDNFIFLLYDKWRTRNISLPDIVFLELFSVAKIARKFEGSEIKEKRIAHLNSFTTDGDLVGQFNRGCRGGPYINALARFYSYPMLSAVDPLWPSFVRFFVENTLDYSYGNLAQQNRTIWPYTFDGVHLSCKGHAFVANEILIPFFKHQMKPRKLEHPIESSRMEEYGIRMFSPATYKIPCCVHRALT